MPLTGAVLNPYANNSRNKSSLCNWYRCFGVVTLFFVILTLTGRGYHKGKVRQHQHTKAAVQQRNTNPSKTHVASTKKEPERATLSEKNMQQIDPEDDDDKYDESDSADSTIWDVDPVADALGTAAKDTGDWIHEQAEPILGQDITHSVGGALDSTLNKVGELTDMVESWWNDGEDGDGDEDQAGEFTDDDVTDAADTGTDVANADKAPKPRLQITTFNIAAINSNPFEYWLTMPENPAYEELMGKIEEFIEHPGSKDVLVSNVFTPQMFEKLEERLKEVGWASVKEYWDNNLSTRSIVNGFLKDASLGSKRLASMPDRITNTISTADGTSVFRPTVINMYDKPLDNQEQWWTAWQSFMFDEALKVKDRDGKVVEQKPWQMLVPIKRAKYPAITEEEEEVSLPLQTLCGAIFDGILVHMMNTVSEPNVWQPLKKTIVENLTTKKVDHTLKILEDQYMDSNILTLQEVSSSMIDQMKERELGKKFHVIAPAALDVFRDQNSVILLQKAGFDAGSWKEITESVQSMFPGYLNVPVANGDLLAIHVKDKEGQDFVMASFHGDTNGLASVPVLDAIVAAMKKDGALKSAKLIFGLDANTYETGKPGKTQDVMAWGKIYQRYELSSCWGDAPQKSNYTTYNARTYLQPQLNKACKRTEKREKGDVNPKDFILFGKSDYELVQTWKDNTGTRKYIEDMAFPTLQFPSDHAILTTIIESTTLPSKKDDETMTAG